MPSILCDAEVFFEGFNFGLGQFAALVVVFGAFHGHFHFHVELDLGLCT